MDSLLPFGQTDIAKSKYRDLLNRNEALNQFQSLDIEKADQKIKCFSRDVPSLLVWLEENGREYPWRYTTDPWRVYITEILLQRTRADAVAEIYNGFFSSFGEPETVVEADDRTIFESVKSLGFGEQRTRSIREAARLCVEHHDGSVPADLKELQKPWRVGPYSARACLLFAFHEPYALVDANIARILGRVFDYDLPEQPHKSQAVYALADVFIPDKPALARALNLAFLDLGALICTEQTPQCPACPLNTCCTYA